MPAIFRKKMQQPSASCFFSLNISKEHKKLKRQLESKNKNQTVKSKTTIKEEVVPDWFDKDLKNEEMSEEEASELDQLLNSISDESEE